MFFFFEKKKLKRKGKKLQEFLCSYNLEHAHVVGKNLPLGIRKRKKKVIKLEIQELTWKNFKLEKIHEPDNFHYIKNYCNHLEISSWPQLRLLSKLAHSSLNKLKNTKRLFN